MNQILQNVYKMYNKEGIGVNSICRNCIEVSKDKNLNHLGPVPIFHVGDEFENDEIKLLIIAYVAYGWDEYLEQHSISTADHSLISQIESRFSELFLKDSEKIKTISGIKSICSEIYGSVESAFQKLAITNVIHCNTGNIRGGAANHMRYNCAHPSANLMVTKKEIEVINPKQIISVAGSGGNPYIEEWNLSIPYLLLPHPAGRVNFKYLRDEAKAFVLKD